MAQAPTTARLEARLPKNVRVSAAHEAARQALEDAEIVRLSLADQERLAKAIAKPPAPSAALKRAFSRRRALLGEK